MFLWHEWKQVRFPPPASLVTCRLTPVLSFQWWPIAHWMASCQNCLDTPGLASSTPYPYPAWPRPNRYVVPGPGVIPSADSAISTHWDTVRVVMPGRSQHMRSESGCVWVSDSPSNFVTSCHAQPWGPIFRGTLFRFCCTSFLFIYFVFRFVVSCLVLPVFHCGCETWEQHCPSSRTGCWEEYLDRTRGE